MAASQRRKIGGWKTLQRRSYFALKLPHRWWLWGIDIQLEGYIDQAQIDFFRKHVKSHMTPGDKVIVCRNGVFGGRMIENVERCGGTAVVVESEWGEPIDPQKLEDALKANPEIGRAAACLGYVHAMLGRDDLAIRFFEQATRTDPGNAATFFDLGFVYDLRRDPQQVVLDLAFDRVVPSLLGGVGLFVLFIGAGLGWPATIAEGLRRAERSGGRV